MGMRKQDPAKQYPFMLEDLRRIAKELGRTPTASDYRKHGKYPASTLIHRFGSFNNAVKAAGLEPREKNVDDQKIVEDLRRVYEIIGRPPSCSEYRKHGKVSIQTIFRRFGNYLSLLRKAGFRNEAKKRVEAMKVVTEDEVFADYCRIVELLGHPPNGKEYKKYGRYSYYRLRKALGGLEQARKRLVEAK